MLNRADPRADPGEAFTWTAASGEFFAYEVNQRLGGGVFSD